MAMKDVLKKLVAFGSKPTPATFPQLLDIVIWLRALLAIGYAFRLRGSSGGAGVIFGLNVISFFPWMYCSVALGVDTDSYDNLLFAGIPNCLALMLLIWIYFYTIDNVEAESKLTAMINVLQAVTAGEDNVGLEGVIPDIPDASEQVLADTEF